MHVVCTHSEEDSEEDGVGGKEEPKVLELQTLVVSWGHNISKSTRWYATSKPTGSLEGLHKESP